MFSAFKLGSHISTISDKIKSIGLPVTSGTVVLTTSLLNYLLSHSVFKCPTQTHAEYGWYFLLLPGVLLAVITLLASVRLSQAFTGFCLKDIDVPKSAMGGKRKRTWKYIIRKISIALVLAILSFMSWVIISLLSTETYACIKIGPVYKRNNLDLEYKMRVEKANIDSKKYGLVLLLFCMLITFMVNVIVKCCFTDLPDKDLPSMRRYDEIEAKAANKEFEVLLQKSADARGIEIVHEFLLHSQKQSSLYRDNDDSQPEVDQESTEKVLSREEVEKLRRFLAIRYPRLDGASESEYCIQSETVEEFFPDKMDGGPSIKDSNEEITLGIISDEMRAGSFQSNGGFFLSRKQ